jgi:hypothetical protein
VDWSNVTNVASRIALRKAKTFLAVINKVFNDSYGRTLSKGGISALLGWCSARATSEVSFPAALASRTKLVSRDDNSASQSSSNVKIGTMLSGSFSCSLIAKRSVASEVGYEMQAASIDENVDASELFASTCMSCALEGRLFL